MADEPTKPIPEYHFVWGDEEIPLVFADNVHWRTAGDRCYVTFGQLELPITDGPVPVTTTIKIRPVVRLVATPETIELWAQTLSQAAKNYKPDGEKK